MPIMKQKPISLGSKVKDTIVGVEGIAVGRANFLYGCSRITIQMPLDKDGKIPDPVIADDQCVKLIKAGPRRKAVRFEIELGAKAKDRVTGFEGRVTATFEHVSGELEYQLTPMKLHEGKPIEPLWFRSGSIELIKELPIKVEPSSISRAGGPQKDKVISRRGMR